MRFVTRSLEIAFIEIEDTVGKIHARHGHRFQRFVIKGHGKLFLAEARSHLDLKLAADDYGAGNRLSSRCIYDWLVRNLNPHNGEATTQRDVYEPSMSTHRKRAKTRLEHAMRPYAAEAGGKFRSLVGLGVSRFSVVRSLG